VRVSYNEALKDLRGHVLTAADGSPVALPRDAALRECYGAAGQGLSAATARASTRYDRESGVNADAKIKPLTADGRSPGKGRLEAPAGGLWGTEAACPLWPRASVQRFH
jgi:hypothetical protein